MSKPIRAQVREIVEEAFAYLGYMPASRPEITEAIDHAFDALVEDGAQQTDPNRRLPEPPPNLEGWEWSLTLRPVKEVGRVRGDCEAAHGPASKGRCPRCRSPVLVVGFESCDCGREQIEQLAPEDIRDREWGVP